MCIMSNKGVCVPHVPPKASWDTSQQDKHSPSKFLHNFPPVFQFCTAALEHNAPAVRELAVRVILSMYRQHRAAVLRFLPPDDAAARKNFLFKSLFDGFAKIDGKLADNQVRSFFLSTRHVTFT